MTLPALETIFAPLRDRPQPYDGIWLDRNWHFETTPVWSSDVNATIAVCAGRYAKPQPLVLELYVFGASPQTPRSLTIASPGAPDQHVTVHTSKAIQILTQTPLHPDGARYSPITLTLDTIISPLQRGTSPDERLLGVQIVSIQCGPSVVTTPLDLTRPATAAGVLGQGWTTPEAELGVWTLGGEAQIELPVYLRPSDETSLVLQTEALPRGEDAEPLMVEIWINGHLALEHTFEMQTSATLRCALSNWGYQEVCEINLRMKGVESPQSLGINADNRPLGLQVRQIDMVANDKVAG